MSHVQDSIAIHVATPWPAIARDLPLPHVELHRGVLNLWFGDEDSPVLRLDPISWDPAADDPPDGVRQGGPEHDTPGREGVR